MFGNRRPRPGATPASSGAAGACCAGATFAVSVPATCAVAAVAEPEEEAPASDDDVLAAEGAATPPGRSDAGVCCWLLVLGMEGDGRKPVPGAAPGSTDELLAGVAAAAAAVVGAIEVGMLLAEGRPPTCDGGVIQE